MPSAMRMRGQPITLDDEVRLAAIRVQEARAKVHEHPGETVYAVALRSRETEHEQLVQARERHNRRATHGGL